MKKIKYIPPIMGGAIVRLVDGQRQDVVYKSIMSSMSKEGTEKLDLSYYNLRNAPSVLDKLAAITDLNLSHNLISHLPSSFGVLACVQVLQLDNNRLQFLPNSIGDLQCLKILSLTHNKCTTLPVSIKRLKALQYIYLDNNHLTSMGELPTNLISISCNKNQIGPMLHDTITNLKALRFFDCEQNKLELLSHTMGRMTRLKRFNVANNKVRRIFEKL